MMYSENALNILAAMSYRGIGRAWIIKNIRGQETVDRIVDLLNRKARLPYQVTVKEFEMRKERLRESLVSYPGHLVAIGDPDFPPHRGRVKDSEKPVVLFYVGNLKLLQLSNRNIAVIGLRNPDQEIESIERVVVAELVEQGVTVVSGLALGCDTIAHQEALKHGGKTVAILPSPLHSILPSQNKPLADKILDSDGLLITEYYEVAKSQKELHGRYQERDRLQALFSDGIILSASYAKNEQGLDSGARLAMQYAANYGIPRAVIYDQVAHANNPKYDLNRQLIAEDDKVIVIHHKNRSLAIRKLLYMGREERTHQPALF